MNSKRWLALFLATVVLLGAAVVAFNYWVDPFGVFSHKAMEWPSYEMTLNPRTAKITYLKEHHDEYDSYLLGSSSTSSFPVASLNRYLDAKFYNMIVYGSDMLDTEEQATYLLTHYTVKNIVVNVYLDNATSYNVEADPLSYAMPPEMTGQSKFAFFSKYLFLDPRHSLDKLKAMRNDTYLTQPFDVFNETTGAYDKTVRDAEGIGSLDAYLQAYPVFANYPKSHIEMNEQAITGTLESLARIRDLCREKGVNFLVLTPPVYYEYLRYFDWEQVVDFYTRLAEVTDYWDFLYSSASFEPRYFYDETHARNCVGQMALARLFGDDSIYVPADLGEHVTRENAAEHWAVLSQTHAQAAEAYTATVPVLMYHHLDQTGNDTTLITPEHFEAQIAALAAAGYTAVLPDELEAYVREGMPLPQKPILITFDDGYLSNYTLAFPILQKYRMKATIFVIGATMGNTEHYKDTDYPITPHFSAQQAREMVASGLISIQSHTYDMHQCKAFEDTGTARETILPLDGESEADYRAALTEDCQQMRRLLEKSIGETNIHVLSYPGGYYNTLAQVTLLENGFDMTFTTEMVSCTLLKGLPQSLLDLGRYNINQAVSIEQLLAWVSSARG